MSKNKTPRGNKKGGRKRKQKTNVKRTDAAGFDKKQYDNGKQFKRQFNPVKSA